MPITRSVANATGSISSTDDCVLMPPQESSAPTLSRSCAPCAAAKRFCDRVHPCERCVRLGMSSECRLTPEGTSTTGSIIVTLAMELTHSPLMTLHDRVVHAMAAAFRSDRFIVTAIPAVPLAVPLHVLEQRATGGLVLNVAGAASEDAAARAAFEGVVQSMMAHSAAPMLRVVYAPPSEFDLACRRVLQPAVVYVNSAWLYSIGVRLFAPWASLHNEVAIGSDACCYATGVPPAECVAVLRLCATMPALRPASMATWTQSRVKHAMLHDSDEAVVAAYANGCFLLTQPLYHDLTRAHNLIAASAQHGYFQSFAAALLRGHAGRGVSTVLEFGGLRPWSEADITAVEGDVSNPDSMDCIIDGAHADVAALMHAHPAVARVVTAAVCNQHVYSMRAQEAAELTFDGHGLLHAVTLAYSNLQVVPPAAGPPMRLPAACLRAYALALQSMAWAVDADCRAAVRLMS